MKNRSENFEMNTEIGLEFLSEKEMQQVRGGIEPTRPISRPKDIYDEEEN